MFLNDFAKDTQVELIVKLDNQEIKLNTEIINRIDKISDKFGYGIVCKPIIIKDKLINLNGFPIDLNIYHTDKRTYSFKVSVTALDIKRKLLLIYSKDDSEAEEYRGAFRIPCTYKTILQFGPHTKAIDSFTHDLSYSGASFLLNAEDADIEIGKVVSSSIFDREGHIYKIDGRVVRIVEDFNPGIFLIGVKFKGEGLRSFVSRLQIQEARLKKL